MYLRFACSHSVLLSATNKHPGTSQRGHAESATALCCTDKGLEVERKTANDVFSYSTRIVKNDNLFSCWDQLRTRTRQIICFVTIIVEVKSLQQKQQCSKAASAVAVIVTQKLH